MRARLTVQQYSAFVGVPFAVVVQIQNDEETIKEVHARPAFIPSENYVSRPLVVSLFPAETADIELEITLPKETPAGLYQMPIEIMDENGPVGTLTANIQVAPRDEVTVTVSPKVVLGGAKTSFIVTTTNRGNRPTGVSVTAGDADRALKYVIEPRRAQLEGGQALAFRVTAKGKRPITGNPVPRAIQIDVASRSVNLSETVTFTQKPRLSRGLLTAVVLLSIIVLWALVFSAGFRAALAGQKAKKSVAADWVEGSKPDPSISIGSLTARIVAASDGRALPRVILTAIPLDTSTNPIASSSDEDGVVQIIGLSPGRYRIQVSGDGYESQTLADETRIVPAVDPVDLGSIRIAGSPATINGSVAADTIPASASITARLLVNDVPTGETLTAVPSGGSTFAFSGLPSPGRYRISFTFQPASDGAPPEYEPLQLDQEVSAGESVTMPSVKLSARPGSITGLVVDDAGLPLGGVTVTANAGADAVSTATATTGDTVGQFVLGELRTPATYLVQFVAEGFGTQTTTITVGPGQSYLMERTIVMSRGTGVVRGEVTDGAGAALGGVTVTASNGAVVGQTLTVDSGGLYSLGGLAAPGTYVLTFSKDGYESEVVSVSITRATGAAVVNVSLDRALSALTGTVVNASGTAVPGVQVVASAGTSSLATLSTDPGGTFRIEAMTRGWWTVTFTAPGYNDTVVLVQMGTTDQDLGSVIVRTTS